MTPVIHPELHPALHRARIEEHERLSARSGRLGAPPARPSLATRLAHAASAALAAGRLAFADPATLRPGAPR